MSRTIILFLVFFSQITFSQGLDPNVLVHNLVANNLEVQDKKSCDKEEEKVQAVAKSCIKDICGPVNKIKSVFLSGELFDTADFSVAEKDFKEKKENIAKAYNNNLNERIAVLEELIKRFESSKELKFSNEEASRLLFEAIKPNLNITYDVETEKFNISYDELNTKSVESQKVIRLVINWIEKNAKKDIELRYDLNLPITKNEYIKYMEHELPITKGHIDSAQNVDLYFVDQIEFLAKNFIQNKKQEFAPDIFFRNNIKFLKELKSNLRWDTGLGEEKIPMTFCKSRVCSKVLNKKFKEELMPTLKNNLKNFQKMKGEVGDNIDKCKSLFYQHEYEYQVRSKHSPQEIMKNFARAYSDFSKYIAKDYSFETSQIFEFKAKMMTNLRLSGLEANKNAQVRDGLTYLQIGTQRYLKLGSDFKSLEGLSDFLILRRGLNPFDLVKTVSNSCFGIESGINTGDDFYNGYTGDLNISSFSCEHPKFGRHAIVHELGHVFSDLVSEQGVSALSKKDYLVKRNCINKRVQIPRYSGIKFKYSPGDHFHSEENMADHLENKSYSHLRELGNAEHFGVCSLFPIKNGDLGRVNLSFDGENHHSPSIFRLLNTAIDRGIDLPTTCKSILETSKHLFKPVKCK